MVKMINFVRHILSQLKIIKKKKENTRIKYLGMNLDKKV